MCCIHGPGTIICVVKTIPQPLRIKKAGRQLACSRIAAATTKKPGANKGKNQRTEQHCPEEFVEFTAYISQARTLKPIENRTSAASRLCPRSNDQAAGKAINSGKLCPTKPRFPNNND